MLVWTGPAQSPLNLFTPGTWNLCMPRPLILLRCTTPWNTLRSAGTT